MSFREQGTGNREQREVAPKMAGINVAGVPPVVPKGYRKHKQTS
ncbi:MAG: hypothetical protein AAGA16_25855 [Cyanobacteria bacterium P01_E01_bin.35]